MADRKNKTEKEYSASSSFLYTHRKKFFFLIAVLLPFIIIFLIEAGLRIFNYGGYPKLFVSTPDENSRYYGINTDAAKRYFTKLSDVPTPRKDLFLKEKPKNGYRIFILGESTAAGFPYGNNLTFPRILNRRLSDAFPDKFIEVVNTGMTAINSYTQLDFMDEILEQKPDAILIYSGHNEYYGALGVGSMESVAKHRWIVKAALSLQKFRVYQLIRNIINAVKNGFEDEGREEEDPSATLMERIVENKIIPYNSSDYQLGKEQFKENMSEIIHKAQDAGVKVIISELVSNVRDNKPFVSVKNNSLPAAQSVFDNAVSLEQQGKYDEAKKAYYLAKDLDALRFRAPEEFNKIIHELGSEYKIPVVPMEAYFESSSPNKLIGDNLMLEHLHPNRKGYYLMADAFFNTMHNAKFISDKWDEKNIRPSSYYLSNWGFTPADSVFASLSVDQLKGGWPFKNVHGPNNTLLNYKPSTQVDSLVIQILVTGRLTLEQAHIELAKYYEGRGDLEKEFNEFNALVYTVPALDLFYEPAAKVLIKMKKYDKALEILNQSLKYNQTAFAYQWLGQIYLITNDTPKGISYLEKAVEMGSQDYALLYNLGYAYYKISKFQRGDAILNQLKNLSANPYYISGLEEFKKVSSQNYNSAMGYIEQAQSCLKNKELNKAISLLSKSAQIQETSLAYELTGFIESLKGEKNLSVKDLEKAYAISGNTNARLLYSLTNAYYISGELSKAKNLLNQLKKSFPGFTDPLNLEGKLRVQN